jgi:hypothetical protein
VDNPPHDVDKWLTRHRSINRIPVHRRPGLLLGGEAQPGAVQQTELDPRATKLSLYEEPRSLRTKIRPAACRFPRRSVTPETGHTAGLLLAQPHTLPRPLLRHRELDFYVAPGGFGVRADLVRVVHQRLRLLAREAGEVSDQLDLEAEAVSVPADADVGRDGGVFA